MKEPTVPISPFHHRSDTKAPPADLFAFLWILSHLPFSVAVSCRTVSSAFRPILKSPVRRCRTFLVVSYRFCDGTDWQGRLTAVRQVRQQQNRYDKNGVNNRTFAKRWLKGFYCPDSHQESRRHRASRGF